MSQPVTIAIVGDHDPSADTHRATDASLGHAAAALGIDLAHRWVPTPALAEGAHPELAADSGVLIAPGSPYASMAGALAADTAGSVQCSSSVTIRIFGPVSSAILS